MSTTHTLMSQESFEKYGGSCCPVCQSDNVEVEPGTLTADGDVAWDDVACHDCASTWRELFRCSEYTQLVVGDGLKDQPCKHCGQALGEHNGDGQCPTDGECTKEALQDAAAQLQASLPFVAVHATPDGPTTANAFDDLDAAREWCQSQLDDPCDTPESELPDEMACIYQDGELVEQITPGDAERGKGWILATAVSAGPNGQNVPEIQKRDEAGVFESDTDALGHVMRLACRKADPEARAAMREIVASWDETR